MLFRWGGLQDEMGTWCHIYDMTAISIFIYFKIAKVKSDEDKNWHYISEDIFKTYIRILSLKGQKDYE